MVISPNVCSSFCLPKNEHLFKTYQVLGVLPKCIYTQQLTWVMSVDDCWSSIFFSSLINSKKSQLMLLVHFVSCQCSLNNGYNSNNNSCNSNSSTIIIIIIVTVKNSYNNNIINQKRNWHWWDHKSNLIRSNQFKVWLLVRRVSCSTQGTSSLSTFGEMMQPHFCEASALVTGSDL